MLDCDITKQQEKRGRFLIQEVEEDCSLISHRVKFTHSEKLKSNLLTINCSKRTKHSSIIMDSKIFHTTRIDSNYSNALFTCLLYDENIKDWVDFDPIWKQFSKVHSDLCEDDMEKIFHYIDTKIDDSDFFCMNTYSNLQSHVEKNLRFEDKIKINENDIKSIESTNHCTGFNTDVTKKTEDNYHSENNDDFNKKENSKMKSIHNKSLFLTNFFDHPIISPAVSPINSNGKFLNFQKDFCEKNKIIPKKRFSVDVDVNAHSDKIKTRTKIFIGRNFDMKKRNLEICRNLSLTFLSFGKQKEKSDIFIVNKTTEIEIKNEINIDSKSDMNLNLNKGDNNRCSICRNKIN